MSNNFKQALGLSTGGFILIFSMLLIGLLLFVGTKKDISFPIQRSIPTSRPATPRPNSTKFKLA